MHTTRLCRGSIRKLCKYLILTLINLALITITSDGGNSADTEALIKGSALAVLDLDGLD